MACQLRLCQTGQPYSFGESPDHQHAPTIIASKVHTRTWPPYTYHTYRMFHNLFEDAMLLRTISSMLSDFSKFLTRQAYPIYNPSSPPITTAFLFPPSHSPYVLSFLCSQFTSLVMTYPIFLPCFFFFHFTFPSLLRKTRSDVIL